MSDTAGRERAPAAVVYAVIRDDGCEYKGIVRQAGLFPGLPKSGRSYEYLDDAGQNLPDTTDGWRRVLHGLMADFLDGKAEILPLEGETTCKNAYCELQPLCRIGELQRLQTDARPRAAEDDP